MTQTASAERGAGKKARTGVHLEADAPKASARERLLAAASELFYEEGINTVGIDRVIERAGVAKASLYSIFGSKEELIRAYLEERHQTRQRRIAEMLARHHTPREQLLSLFDYLGDIMLESRFRGCAFVRAGAELRSSSSARSVCDETRGWMRSLLARLAAEAGAAHPEQLARQLALLYDGAVVAAQMDHDTSSASAARATAAALLDAAGDAEQNILLQYRTQAALTRRVWLSLVAAALVAVGATYEWSVREIRDSAESIAGNAPYCVQVPDGNRGYREAQTPGDTSLFRMRAPSAGTGALHHAVLAVDRPGGTQLLHWSYWHQSFEDGALGPPAIYCKARPHYLAAWPEPAVEGPDVTTIRVAGMDLSIPSSFRAVATDNSHGVTFYAASPAFGPIQATPKDSQSQSPHQIADSVEVEFGRTGFLEERLPRNKDGKLRVEDAGSELGLNKQLVWNLPPTTSPLYRPSADYYAIGPDGRLQTVVACDSLPVGNCLHAFYFDGWTYTFHHPRSLLGQWKTMQMQLSSKTRSFVSAGTAVSFETTGLFGTHLTSMVRLADKHGQAAAFRPPI